MSKKNILVFPCGSEVALEIYKSLEHSTHFNLIGASSVDDHGKFVFGNYIGTLPFISEPGFIDKMCFIIQKNKIDAIFPAMDAVITLLKQKESLLGCKVIASPVETTEICLSKTTTYKALKGVVALPTIYANPNEIKSFPVFLKPDIGYGSRGVLKGLSRRSVIDHLSINPDSIILEFLPGREFTVDCFTNSKGELLFAGPRERRRISNGISVNTIPVNDSDKKFISIATAINNNIKFRGAWFFQLKENTKGELVLLEIASRLGGSSGLFRNKGINFSQLSVFDAFGYEVEINENNYQIELDRALCSKYKVEIEYDEAFVDFDDCMIIDNAFYNTDLMKFIFTCLNKKIRLTVLSRHKGDLTKRLTELKINTLFDRILHIKQNENKSDYIDNLNAIFIDDSFAERKDVAKKCNIPVFSLDMIESLI